MFKLYSAIMPRNPTLAFPVLPVIAGAIQFYMALFSLVLESHIILSLIPMVTAMLSLCLPGYAFFFLFRIQFERKIHVFTEGFFSPSFLTAAAWVTFIMFCFSCSMTLVILGANTVLDDSGVFIGLVGCAIMLALGDLYRACRRRAISELSTKSEYLTPTVHTYTIYENLRPWVK